MERKTAVFENGDRMYENDDCHNAPKNTKYFSADKGVCVKI